MKQILNYIKNLFKKKNAISDFSKIYMPIIKSIFPSNPINDIVGVTPLKSASGNTFSIKYKVLDGTIADYNDFIYYKQLRLEQLFKNRIIYKNVKPMIRGAYKITLLEYLQYGSNEQFIKKFSQNIDCDIVYYDDIGFLSGTEGFLLVRDSIIIGQDVRKIS